MDVERHDISLFAKMIHRLFMNLAKYLPAVQNCKAVQDKYLKSCLDPKTNKPTRFREGVGMSSTSTSSSSTSSSSNQVDMSPSNSWMWYNTAPEILPYKKARIVIEQQAKRKQTTTTK